MVGSHFIWYAEISLRSMAKKVKHNGQTLLRFTSTEAENKKKKTCRTGLNPSHYHMRYKTYFSKFQKEIQKDEITGINEIPLLHPNRLDFLQFQARNYFVQKQYTIASQVSW